MRSGFDYAQPPDRFNSSDIGGFDYAGFDYAQPPDSMPDGRLKM